ncbi:YeiH family putative sulfate export transporter [Polynucleobacter paneuropaeus]|nr:YeiH family putative sulfate export transporter [Polynucleobacter paneuropaeus]
MKLFKYLPGIFFASIIALIAIEMSIRYPSLARGGLSILTLSIIVGIFIGNLPIYKFLISYCGSGINFSKQKVLRLGIILYGFRLTFQDIEKVGLNGVMIDVLTLTSTFLLAVYLGVRFFKLDKDTAILIGSGSSICGAAAILATEPVLKASNERVTVAISTIVIFGTIAIFLYPVLYSFLALQYPGFLSPEQYGVYIGSTVHEVAQVVATANSIGDDVTSTAVITKMVRVIMLAPFLVLLSIWVLSKTKVPHELEKKNSSLHSFGKHIPVFAVLFIVVIGLNSTGYVPKEFRENLISIDNFLLALAMGALGLTTHFSALASAGTKPLKLAFVLFVWLMIGGGFINYSINFLLAT